MIFRVTLIMILLDALKGWVAEAVPALDEFSFYDGRRAVCGNGDQRRSWKLDGSITDGVAGGLI